MIETLTSFRLVEAIDLAIVWLLVWAGIAWLRATPARLAAAGLAILVAFYLVARQFGLVMTTWILQGFGAAALLIAVVIFQQDLRRLFEQIAAVGFRRRQRAVGPDIVDTIVRTLANLAEQHRGALIVIPGREPIDGHVEGGLTLEARITEPLLLSLFDPHSPGHDGAVIFVGERVDRFAVHLPLSTDHGQLGQRGTRHAAALGLAERTDALCIVVSEERGTVSLAEAGRLRTLGAAHEAADEIRRFLADLAPGGAQRRPRGLRILERWREAALALPVAGLIWVLAVPGATVVEVTRKVPVSVNGVPPGFEVETLDPASVEVTLTGPRLDLYLLGPDALRVRVDAILVELGRRSFSLSAANVRRPEGIEVQSIQPDTVKVSLRERRSAAPPTAGPAPAGP